MRPLAPVAAMAIGGALIVTRSIRLDDSLTNDEAYTLAHFVRPGPGAFLLGPYIPNDHILFSALTWINVEALGTTTEVGYRLWGIVPGLAAVGLVGWWAWRRLGPWLAVGFLYLVLLSPLHGTWSWQARGYGLTFLASATMLVATAELGVAAHHRSRWIVAFCLAGLVGIAALPVLVLPFAAGTALLLTDATLRRPVGIGAACVVVASAVVYGWVWQDVLGSRSQEFGARLPWHGTLTTVPEQLLATEGRLVDADLAGWTVVLVFWLAAVVGAAWIARRASWRAAAAVATPIVVSGVALTAARVHVEPRFVSFLLLGALLLVAAGFAAAIDALRRVPAARAAAVAGTLVLCFAGAKGYQRLLRHELGLPIEDYRGVASIIDGAGYTRVVVNSDVHVGFEEYLGPERVTFPPAERLEQAVCRAGEPVAYVEYGAHASPVALPCLGGDGVTAVRVPQLTGWPDEPMEVWLLPAARS